MVLGVSGTHVRLTGTNAGATCSSKERQVTWFGAGCGWLVRMAVGIDVDVAAMRFLRTFGFT